MSHIQVDRWGWGATQRPLLRRGRWRGCAESVGRVRDGAALVNGTIYIVCSVPASARACPCLDLCRRSQVGTLEFDAWTHDLLLMFIDEFELPDVRWAALSDACK